MSDASPFPAVSKCWLPPSSFTRTLLSPIGSANNLAEGASSTIILSPASLLTELVPSNKNAEWVKLTPVTNFPFIVLVSGSKSKSWVTSTPDSDIILFPISKLDKDSSTIIWPRPFSKEIISPAKAIGLRESSRIIVSSPPTSFSIENTVPNSVKLLSSSNISSSKLEKEYSIAVDLRLTSSWKIILNVEASTGENVSVSDVYPPPRLEPTVGNAADTCVAILTLLNTLNPAGCTAFFSSVK